MEIGKKNILTLAMLAAITPAAHMYAMNNNDQLNNEQEEDRKDQAAAVAIPFTPEHIEYVNKALIEAVKNNNLEAAKTALNNGANPNIYDSGYGWPLLITAIRSTKNTWKMVDLLLTYGADVNAVGDNRTVLEHAIQSLRYSDKLVKILLTHNANVDKKNSINLTFLLLLAKSIVECYRTNYPPAAAELVKQARMLIFIGADLSLTDNDGKTALDILADEPTAAQSLHAITEVCNIKQTITDKLNALKIALQKESYQNPCTPVEEIVRANAADYTIPYYQNNADNDSLAYELLNECTTKQWMRIKAEVEAARLLNRYHLEIQNVTDIVLGYLASDKN